MIPQVVNYPRLIQEWKNLLDNDKFPKITDYVRKGATAVQLENMKSQGLVQETNEPTNVTGGVQKWDPILMAMVRRSAPVLIAYDVCGVQPLTGPTGLIFAFRSRYTTQGGTEALHNEADTDFSGAGTHSGTDPLSSMATAATRYGSTTYSDSTGIADTTSNKEGNITAKMAFSIEKFTVTAGDRALATEYSEQLRQDFHAIHGGDADAELANILSTELTAEINREVVRTINSVAKQGCSFGTTTAGVFDLDTDSSGRWSIEKFKGLAFQLDREANQIAKETRRGKGNIMICSSDVASALNAVGQLDYNPNANLALNVDDTGNTFVGTLNGKIKVFIDPYFSSAAGHEYATLGYKGPNPYDAGLYYCPWIPLQMYRATDPNSFQPKLAFRCRYGIGTNPFVTSSPTPTNNSNQYYRIFKISNVL